MIAPRRRLALLAPLLFGFGCPSSRPTVGSRATRDAAPAVVVVARPATKPIAARPAALAVVCVPEREPNDDLAHAQPLELPKGVEGELAASAAGAAPDTDVYQWLAPGEAATVARVELLGAPGEALAIEALDGEGKRLTSADEAAEGEALVIPNLGLAPGAMTRFRVRRAGKRVATALPAARYRLLVLLGPPVVGEELEPNDSVEKAQPFTSDLAGRFGRRRDEDFLKLTADVAAGSTLRFELSPVERVAATVRLLDAGAALLVEAKGGRGAELRLRNAPLGAAGTFIVVRAESGFDTEARWIARASVEPALEGAEREPNQLPATATEIPLAGDRGAVAGFLWPGDVDVFMLRPPEARALQATLEVPDGVDGRLEWLAASGKAIIKADAAGVGRGESLPSLSAAAGEAVYLRVSARPRDTAFDAPYTLTIKASAAP